MEHFSKTILLAGFLLSLTACVSPQPAGEVSTLSVSSAQTSLPSAPTPVRWGGTIATIENTAEGTTVLEVVARPLNMTGRPVRNDRTDGRFIAELDAFLDPEIVKTGRDITVTGEVGSLRVGTVGKTEYAFPVVTVEDYRYWKLVPKTNPSHLPHPALHHHHYDDFWHDWPHSRHREKPPRTATGARGAEGTLDD